ncbi:MAG: sensor histidine kinase [Lachnospiraceae bacterium]
MNIIRKSTMQNRKSLRGMLVPVFFLAAIIPMVLVTMLSQSRLRSNMRGNLDKQAESNLYKANQCLDMVLDKYSIILSGFCANEELLRLANDIENNQKQVCYLLNRICIHNEGISDMTLTTEKGEKYHSLEEPEKGMNAFQLSRNLVDASRVPQSLGVVTLSIDEKIVKSAVANKMPSRIYVCEGKRILSAPKQEEVGKQIQEIDATNYRVTKYNNNQSGWEIYNFQSMRQYRNTVSEQLLFWLFIGVGTSLVLVSLIYWFTRPVIHSLNNMVHVMNEAENGNFEVRIPFYKNMPSELYQIGLGFNEMMEQIDVLIQQVKQSAVEQKNAELSALEAQIDPHFLYNTLDTINWKAIEQEEYEISEMIGALADILRYTVRNAGAKTSIEQELAWLREYTLLQSVKLGKKLEIIINVPDKLMGCQIHKLLLQPFVENALKHGMYQTEGPCILKISMYQAENQLHIVIKDNGKGLSIEEVRRLNAGQEEQGEHLGIENVRKRLKLYYSEDAALYFESEPECYTKVHLFIPMTEVTEDENCNCRR